MSETQDRVALSPAARAGRIRALRIETAELRRLIQQGKQGVSDEDVNESKGLIRTLFDNWRVGGKWIKDTQAQAAQTLRAVSPLGRVRHLWGYMHYDKGMHAAMDRRGPNSIIQGNASDLGFMASANLRRMIWTLFLKRGLALTLRQVNSVHDSGTHVCRFEELPIALYLIEHAMTTEVHRRCRDLFKHQLIVDLEIDVEIGGSEGDLSGWDLRYDGIMGYITSTMDWQTKELGYEYSPAERAQILADAQHNLRIVQEARQREIMHNLDKPNEVSYIRLINLRNIARFTWKLGKGAPAHL